MDTVDTTPSQSHAYELVSRVLNGPPAQAYLRFGARRRTRPDFVAMVRLVVAIEEKIGRQLSDLELERIETIADVEKLVKSRRPP